jgi:hypothetical protein
MDRRRRRTGPFDRDARAGRYAEVVAQLGATPKRKRPARPAEQMPRRGGVAAEAIPELDPQRIPRGGGNAPRELHEPLRVNRTGNARAGQTYSTRKRAGGVEHVYSDGKRVFVPDPRPSIREQVKTITERRDAERRAEVDRLAEQIAEVRSRRGQRKGRMRS